MGRYGVGHGALAIRRERNRRHRRSSVAGDRVHHQYTRTDNYLHFYNRHQQRKSSVGSSQSAPVKGSGDGGAVGEPSGRNVVIPGQVPPSPLAARTDQEAGRPARPSREWWPGPPLRQGGVVVRQQEQQQQQPQEEDSDGGNGFLSDVVGLFAGMNTWNKFQTRLWSKDKGAAEPEPQTNGDAGTTKNNHQVSFADEVGMWG